MEGDNVEFDKSMRDFRLQPEADEHCALLGYRVVLVTKLSWPFSSYSPGIRFRRQKVAK